MEVGLKLLRSTRILKKCKKKLKALKNQNKMLFIISKKSGSHRELKKVNKTRGKSSKKRCDSSNDSSSEESYSDSSLSSDLYTLPRIGGTMQQLEGFQYATTLYIGYYNIRLYPSSQYTKMIVTEFGKFRYNHLPMGICSSEDIFQSKVDEILSDIEGVKTYIDDILVLSKYFFRKHIKQLRKISGRLRTAGLKVNAPKCIFGLKEIPYIGCVITGEGIKPNPKKVQGIMDIGRPVTTTEARALIGMVQ